METKVGPHSQKKNTYLLEGQQYLGDLLQQHETALASATSTTNPKLKDLYLAQQNNPLCALNPLRDIFAFRDTTGRLSHKSQTIPTAFLPYLNTSIIILPSYLQYLGQHIHVIVVTSLQSQNLTAILRPATHASLLRRRLILPLSRYALREVPQWTRNNGGSVADGGSLTIVDAGKSM
jgi:hypothetical protein